MITIRHRIKGAKWQQSEPMATDAEARSYVLKLPEAAEVVWSGQPEQADPPRTPRAMWVGTLGFGLVSAPVKFFAATEDGTPAMKQLCREHAGPVSFRRWCSTHDHELHAGEIAKGIEVQGGYVVLDDADLTALKDAEPKSATIEEFVPAGSVPAIFQDRTYYVAPDKGGRRPYDLLAAALARTGTVALGKVTIRERSHLCLVRPEAGRLLLTTLHWPEEVRSNERLAGLAGDPEVSEPELQLAVTLLEGMMRPGFDASRYHDTYAVNLAAKLEAKADSVRPVQADPAGKVVDLMGSLKASVEAAKAAKGKPAGGRKSKTA